MPTVVHASLTGANLHEPKGAAAASAGEVYVADGAASGSFGKLTHTSLQTTGNPFGAQLFHVREVQTSGTEGGTFTSGFQIRTLNNSSANEISGASLGSNQVTLPAGTYFIHAFAPAFNVGAHKIIWQSVTTPSILLGGMSSYSNDDETVSILMERLTIAGVNVFELKHFATSTQPTNGFGRATSAGVSEIYSNVYIWKLA